MDRQTVAAAVVVKEYEGHTLGPWEARVNTPPQWWVTVAGENFHVIATTTQGNDEANACLIADAPMLLKNNATLVELCRQLKDDLSQSVAMLSQIELLLLNNKHDELPALGPFIYDSRMRSIKTLALWPDGGE